VDIGSASLALPLGIQEIAIGVVMIVILMFRLSGLTNNKELMWQGWPFKRLSAGRSPAPAG
jgi:branched-chain amino acid transport system permease protein